MNLITKKELAKFLGISISTVDRGMVKGMPYIKIGKSVRFDKEKVLKWFEEGSNERD